MYRKLDEAALGTILEAGIAEFARCGFQPASVASVAKNAGVSVGVIYKYFGDKDAFFLACVRHSLELLDATLQEAAAGGGPLEELCRTCDLPNVRFVGFKTGRELQELVAAARFTLHLSLWYENCPLALLESQSLGTPVLVEEGKTGILNDTFTPEAYAEKIRALYSDSALLDEMARSCRAKKESMMTLDRYCDRLLEIYMEEIGGKRA